MLELWTYEWVYCLISVLLKVQVMQNRMFAALLLSREHDAHVELAPSFLLDPERW